MLFRLAWKTSLTLCLRDASLCLASTRITANEFVVVVSCRSLLGRTTQHWFSSSEIVCLSSHLFLKPREVPHSPGESCRKATAALMNSNTRKTRRNCWNPLRNELRRFMVNAGTRQQQLLQNYDHPIKLLWAGLPLLDWDLVMPLGEAVVCMGNESQGADTLTSYVALCKREFGLHFNCIYWVCFLGITIYCLFFCPIRCSNVCRATPVLFATASSCAWRAVVWEIKNKNSGELWGLTTGTCHFSFAHA